MYTLHITGKTFCVDDVNLILVSNALLLGKLDFTVKIDFAESNRLIDYYNSLDNADKEVCVFLADDRAKGIVCNSLKLSRIDCTTLRVQAQGI